MNLLLTGSSGLLGQCLARLLVERGDKVTGLDMVDPPIASEAVPIDLVRADMSDRSALREAAQGAEVIYHLAAAQRMKPQFSNLDEQEIYDMNLGAVANVLAVAAELGTRKVVFVSSSGIYGIPQTIPCTESHPTIPLGAYGDSKLEAEALCRKAIDEGLDVTVLRPMSLFGPRMTGVFAILFEWVRTGQFVFTLGAGKNRVQMVSAWDVAEACICAAQTTSKVRFFNIGSAPEEVPTVYEQVRALIEHAGTRSRVIRVPAALLRTAAKVLDTVNLSPIVPEHYLLADSTFLLDIGQARAELGWEPKRNNVQLMNEAYDWYLENVDEYRPAPQPILSLLALLSSKRS